MRRNEGLVARYLDRLDDEAEALHARYPGALDTVYFGGGTPSHLSDDELTRVVSTLARTWGWPPALETTLEADPLTFDRDRLTRFRDLGFGRLSIGLQSTQDGVLSFLGRLHDGRQGLDAVEMALDVGFEVSADLITAVPGQDSARDLHTFAATGVPHISVYTLTIEPYTPFGRRGVTVDPEREADDYLHTDAILSDYGYRRYEVSSHALPGHEAIHNQIYWHGEPFLALGPSAAGFYPEGPGPGVRTKNPPIKRWLEGAEPERETLTAEDYTLERLMTGLRTTAGVDLADLHTRSGLDPSTLHAHGIERGTKLGLLELSKGRLRATEEGVVRLDGVLRELFF
jgi:oxygen-independent coproporphyrinogen-3 oxidase